MSSINLTQSVIDDIRHQDRIFEIIARGGKKDIKLLENELLHDPKKYIYDRTDSKHIINKHNRLNQNPLYIACKHGSLEMVSFLLKEQADPHILSEVEISEKESIL